MRLIANLGFVLTFILTTPAAVWPAAAQTVAAPASREESLRQQREEKSRNAQPNKLDPIQRALTAVEERGLFLLPRDGFFPRIGGAGTGSSFGISLGYRTRDIFKRYGTLEVFGATSVRKYWALQATATFPSLAEGRLFAEAIASMREAPQEKFFGLGPDAARADETEYLSRTNRLGGRGGVRFGRFVSVGGALDYLTPRISRGRDDDVPSTEDKFSAEEVPGLINGNANYLRSAVFADFDYRQPLNPRQGGWYRIERTHHSDRTTGQFTFDRTDIDLRQYLGFFNGRRVIALRGVYSTTDVAADHEVPFYYMPWLGGRDTLRGFKNYRFRAPHSLLMQAEYRWEIWSGLDGALFYDTGKVAMTRKDIDLSGLVHAYGIGLRFNTNAGVVLRFDFAFANDEGMRLHMNAGPAF